SLMVTGRVGDELGIRVSCSKGTYIRVLAEDIGRRLGCGGSLSALRREGVGGFMLGSGGVTLERLGQRAATEKDAALLPVDALVASLPRLDLDAAEERRFNDGQALQRSTTGLTEGLARIYGPAREFLGVAQVTSAGHIAPKRLTARGQG